MIQILYLVHGTTTDNEQKISSGWHDAPLSELGRQQMRDLPAKLGGRSFDVVFCSDLQRAIDSAQLAFGGKVPIVPDKRLRECNYGHFNAQPSAIVEPKQEQSITSPFPGGESYEDVKARMADFLTFLKANYDNKTVAIVAHKAPQLALEVVLKGKTWEQAFADDWRKTGAWQPGWGFELL